jgi:hypothetical protein
MKSYRPTLGEALVHIRALELLLTADGSYARAIELCRESVAATALDARRAAFYSRVYRKLRDMQHDATDHDYDVIVGNVGTVYRGNSEKDARAIFRDYVGAAQTDRGRASGEAVTLMRDGDIIEELSSTITE